MIRDEEMKKTRDDHHLRLPLHARRLRERRRSTLPRRARRPRLRKRQIALSPERDPARIPVLHTLLGRADRRIKLAVKAREALARPRALSPGRSVPAGHRSESPAPRHAAHRGLRSTPLRPYDRGAADSPGATRAPAAPYCHPPSPGTDPRPFRLARCLLRSPGRDRRLRGVNVPLDLGQVVRAIQASDTAPWESAGSAAITRGLYFGGSPPARSP